MSEHSLSILGTALTAGATKVMMLGCGELGKEVVIELQRLGVEVIAVDRYANAPAMQVAHRSHVVDMLDSVALKALIEKEAPDLVVPEIEAIATPTLVAMEQAGLNVVPTAIAARLTMDREGIRRQRPKISMSAHHPTNLPITKRIIERRLHA
jgi:phosphoribosylglycinamide formyltransferase 2